MSGLIFISYRREESRWSARSLYDRLSASFGPKQIFMDIDAIALGEDFIKAIERTVSECDVLIAIIGANWLTSKDDQGDRRLNNPEDFVRMEIATALSRDIRVIPVLVDGALMPRPTELPDDLKPLVRRNALRISDTSFDGDCQRLVAAIKQVLETERLEKERLETERLEKERLEAEGHELEEKERLEAGRRQKEEQEQLEAEQRQREETERIAQRREREQRERAAAKIRERPEKQQLDARSREHEEQERLEPEPQAQPPSPVAPSTPPAKPEADKPSAETQNMVYPPPPKPTESGGTGGKRPSRQAIAFLAITAVLVVGGLIYLAIIASRSPPPQPAPLVTPVAIPSPSISATQSKVKIGVTMALFDDLWLTRVRNAMTKWASNHPDVELTIVDARKDTAKQTGQVENFLAEGMDAIIIQPVDTAATGPMTKTVVKAGKALVYVNRKPSNLPEGVVYCGSNSIEAGIMNMEELGRCMEGKGNLVILMGDLDNEATIGRTDGIKQVVREKFQRIKIIREQTGNWKRDQGKAIMLDWLDSGQEIDGVASNNDEMALGALQAIKAAGKLGKICVGGTDASHDALESIAKGELNNTVFEDPAAQGEESVNAAYLMVKEAPNPKVVDGKIWIPCQKVTTGNFESFMK